MVNRILVPLDGSSLAEAALPIAQTIVQATRAALRLVSVVECASPPASDPLERRRKEGYLDGIARRIEGASTGAPSVSVLEGGAAEQIEAEAKAWSADLLVMCTHGSGGHSRAWIGSVADRCVRAGFSPVLLLRPEEQGGEDRAWEQRIDRVVLPLDGSAVAERALPCAAAAARAFAVPAVVLRVVAQPTAAEFLQHPDAEELVERLREQDRVEAEEYVDRKATELSALGISASAAVIGDSEPARALIDRSRGDLIVLSTHGRGGRGGALFGSVTDKVVRGGKQPVLVISARSGSRDLEGSAN